MTGRRAGTGRPARVAAVAAVALGLGLGLSACTTFDGPDDPFVIGGGGSEDVPDEVVVEATTGSVEMVVGQTLVVDFGEINTSVGDSWELAQDPDDVLSEGEAVMDYLGEDGETGSPSTLVYELRATGEGRSVLEFTYVFRGEVPDFGHGPAPVTITVDVTDG